MDFECPQHKSVMKVWKHTHTHPTLYTILKYMSNNPIIQKIGTISKCKLEHDLFNNILWNN